MNNAFVIGVDFGTDSVRTVIVNAHDGHEVASSIFDYPRWKAGLYCDASKNMFRQHPLDYLEGLEHTIKQCLHQSPPIVRNNVKAISVDTTGSTPVAVDPSGTPLALLDPFTNNPDAMFVLWKDHTATQEAADINALAATSHINYLKYSGGIYSSEWFWAKWLHIVRHNPAVASAAYSFVEHCDWIPMILTGCTNVHHIKRSVCAAGHKALWSPEWNGLPPDKFFAALQPAFAGVNKRLFTETFTADQPAGHLCKTWAAKLGLSESVLVGVGAFDAHMGAVGGQIEPNYLSRVMGTSTCDMLVVAPHELQNKVINGICGQVEGSILPSMIGLEAGQSAFGDVYAWLKNVLAWPLLNIPGAGDALQEQILPALADAAASIPVNIDDELAVDWLNGRRTPDANQLLRGAITGLNLSTTAPHIFKSLVEATSFGARSIIDCFTSQGIHIKGLIGLGGVAKKSPYIMQTLADITGMNIRIHSSDQTCAAGAAMFAATVAGIHATVEEAVKAMGQGFEKTYKPNKEASAMYNQRYARYKKLGHFIEHTL